MTQNIPEHNNIWSATLGLLEMKIPKASFETWLKDTFVLSSKNNVRHLRTSTNGGTGFWRLPKTLEIS